jgi:hypothetical protein
MRTRRRWQATVGERDTVLGHRAVAQDADAQVRDGQLSSRPNPRHSPCDSLERSVLAWEEPPVAPPTQRERDEEL